MESIGELRQKVQAPVRQYNDVAGLLVGDRVSIHVTRMFVWLGWSPTVATLSMLVVGVAGSMLLLVDRAWAQPVGFFLVFMYYILDCVDGEVARYHRGEKLVWGFHDFLFHLYVKSAFFICLGLYALRATNYEVWVFALALAALLASLFQKFLYDVPLMLACRYVIMRRPEERDHFLEQIMSGAPSAQAEAEQDLRDVDNPYAFRGVFPFLRTALTNFDLMILLFLAASILDLWVPSFYLYDTPANIKVALLIFYGVILPLDFADRLTSFIRNKKFYKDARRLLRFADQFHIK